MRLETITVLDTLERVNPAVLAAALRQIEKADDDLWDAAIAEEGARSVMPALRGAFRAGAKDAIARFELGIDFDVVEPRAVEYGELRGAELIGKKWVDGVLVDNPKAEWVIEQTTREAVRDMVREAVRDGWSMDDFAGRLEESGVFSESRAEMIARTETAIAENRGHAAAFREEGVELVYIYDGDYDEECQAANGEVWTLEEFEANPIEHPNCLRDARPLTESELAEEEGEP
jgi:PAS domain-containing protein